ncbi:hypothetical protein MKX33_24835 [Paenibacillus sp. FSL R5-0490]|uniref:hypothetical protein n=1 Tax=Paenibacillus TaxID=44249 RepID=UPI0020A04F55|nr:hypothetical protein [Paenibacillus xylanexedens]MCP1427228.1 hypothetical protein [Paenibacillus xylanexedens]
MTVFNSFDDEVMRGVVTTKRVILLEEGTAEMKGLMGSKGAQRSEHWKSAIKIQPQLMFTFIIGLMK